MFYVNDLRISYPHAEHQRVTVGELLLSTSLPLHSSHSLSDELRLRSVHPVGCAWLV